jgi:hypothetical protein
MTDIGQRQDLADDGTLERRNFLQAIGALSAPSFAGCVGDNGDLDGGSTSRANAIDAENAQISRSDAFAIDPDEMNLGGRRIVTGPDNFGYDTISEAWEAAVAGDIIYVHGSYDAQAAGEPFPIQLNNEVKEVSLVGGHPSGSVIDARHTDENVIEVLGRAQNDFRNKCHVQGLKIRGGNVGLRIQAAPYSVYRDLVIFQTDSHGVEVNGYTDPTGAYKGSYGISFFNCIAWSCRGAGFKLHPSAVPHSTSFYGCHALFNGLYDQQSGQPGVQLRGYASRWHGGTVQNNGGFGIDARSGSAQSVHATYFEGNGMVQDYPHDVFTDGSSPGFSLSSCYFQGHYARDAPNGREDAMRAIALAGTPSAKVANCVYRNYTDSFIHVRDARDVDLHVPSHVALDETPFMSLADSNERVRSDGMIIPTDLRETGMEGKFRGDVGVHDGSGSQPFGPAIWNGDAWLSVMTGEQLS